MNLYKVSQSTNRNYDTFDSMVVVAESAEEARDIDPERSWYWKDEGDSRLYIDWDEVKDRAYTAWCTSSKDVKVVYLGEADERFKKTAIIIASFNAG